MAKKINKTKPKSSNDYNWIALSEIRKSMLKKGKSVNDINKMVKSGAIETKTVDGIKMCSVKSWNKYLESLN